MIPMSDVPNSNRNDQTDKTTAPSIFSTWTWTPPAEAVLIRPYLSYIYPEVNEIEREVCQVVVDMEDHVKEVGSDSSTYPQLSSTQSPVALRAQSSGGGTDHAILGKQHSHSSGSQSYSFPIRCFISFCVPLFSHKPRSRQKHPTPCQKKKIIITYLTADTAIQRASRLIRHFKHESP